MTGESISRERYLQAYGWMLLARALEDKIASLYRAGGKIVGGVYLGRGQEAFSVALGISLKQGDIFGPLIRDQGGRLAFGEPLLDAPRTYLGSVLGPMRGRDGNIHRGRPSEGMPAMISHLGSLVSVVAGMLLARRFKGDTTCVGATSIGDGGTSTGAFHEGLNLAAVEKLPLVIAVANNQYAYSTENNRQFACEDLVSRAIGYGIEGHTVDGTNLMNCLAVFEKAVAHAREGRGPQLVVGSLLRLSGHGEHDDASYVRSSLKDSPLGQDCLTLSRAQIEEKHWASSKELDAMQAHAANEVAEAIAQVQREPAPNALQEHWQALASASILEK